MGFFFKEKRLSVTNGIKGSRYRAYGKNLRSDTTLRIWPLVLALLIIKKRILLREVQRLSPIDDLAIGVMSVLRAERGPADETFEHDSSNRPPVTSERVALTTEDFRGDIVGSADC